VSDAGEREPRLSVEPNGDRSIHSRSACVPRYRNSAYLRRPIPN
jgi:hypothetical protein